MVLHIEKQIKKKFPQVGHAPYRQIHAHSTGNKRSTVQNEADNLNRPERANEDGFFSHVIGNGRIIQLHEVGQGAWDVGGGWNAEGYAHVELIESHKSKEEFLVDYKLYVELLRQLAKEAGLPVTLDGVSRDTDGAPMGIVTHAYCTEHQPDNRSDHVDPYPYLARWGISKEQFAKDLADGFEETEEKKKEEEEDMFTISAPNRGIALMTGGRFYALLDANDPAVFWGKGVPHMQVSAKTFDNFQSRSNLERLDDETVKKLTAGLK